MYLWVFLILLFSAYSSLKCYSKTTSCCCFPAHDHIWCHSCPLLDSPLTSLLVCIGPKSHDPLINPPLQVIYWLMCMWMYMIGCIFEPFVIPTYLNDDVFLDDPDEGYKPKLVSLMKLLSNLQVLLELFDLFSGWNLGQGSWRRVWSHCYVGNDQQNTWLSKLNTIIIFIYKLNTMAVQGSTLTLPSPRLLVPAGTFLLLGWTVTGSTGTTAADGFISFRDFVKVNIIMSPSQ